MKAVALVACPSPPRGFLMQSSSRKATGISAAHCVLGDALRFSAHTDLWQHWNSRRWSNTGPAIQVSMQVTRPGDADRTLNLDLALKRYHPQLFQLRIVTCSAILLNRADAVQLRLGRKEHIVKGHNAMDRRVKKA